MKAMAMVCLVLCACSTSTVDAGAYYDEESIEQAIDAWVEDGGAYEGTDCEADRDEVAVLALPAAADSCTTVPGCARVVMGDDPVLLVSGEPERRRETTIEAATQWLRECSR